MKIVIDPGHGGKDPGAISNVTFVEYYEKKFNLVASLMLTGLLYFDDNLVLLTRYKDEAVSLKDRTKIANDFDANIYISIHCNSFITPEPNGFEAYFYTGSIKGLLLAQHICGSVGDITWLNMRGYKAGTFHVLKYTKMPAVLLELGFLSNSTDLGNLSNTNQLFSLIAKIKDGITGYLGSQNVY